MESVNDLVANAAADADKATTSTEVQVKTEEASTEKKAKKDKEKGTRMMYSDNETSPEEKLAKLPRYAFVPDRKGETVLGDATTAAAVTGVVKEDGDTMAE